MTVSSQMAGEWIKAWIDGQRATIQRGLDAQQNAAGDSGTAFADLFQQLTDAGQAWGMPDFGDQIGALWRKFIPTAPVDGAFPSFGPLREQQETLKDLASAIADYQRLSSEMAGVLAKVHSDTLDLLRRRSQEQANSGQPIESFKALYDLWIECGETSYASVAHGDAYCRLQADFCNAGIRVRFCQQQLLERWLKELDLPTRSELNTLHQRLKDLRKQVETVTSAGGESSVKMSTRRAKPSVSAVSSDKGNSRRRASRKKS